MNVDAAREFVRHHHSAVLMTLRRDGAPQMSPVLVGVAADDRLVISTRETAFKVRNIERDPRVFLCVLSDGFFGRWMQVSGSADICRLPEAMEPLVAYYRDVSGEHPDWGDYRAAMVRDKRCLIRITIESAGPDHAG
jgi:PPOX class probable F420-dependent enzyme